MLYRFDVNLLHVRAIRPPTRQRRGGGTGACGPRPCSRGFRRRGVACNAPSPRDIPFQGQSHCRMSKRTTNHRMRKVDVTLVLYITVQVGWFGGAVPLQEVLFRPVLAATRPKQTEQGFCRGRRPPQPLLANLPLNGYMLYSNPTSVVKNSSRSRSVRAEAGTPVIPVSWCIAHLCLSIFSTTTRLPLERDGKGAERRYMQRPSAAPHQTKEHGRGRRPAHPRSDKVSL